jgi:preprotein translocase subunit SecD
LQIRAGALPVPIEIIEQKTIGATLGKESIDKSLKAGAVGLLGVMVFMVIMYGRLGLIADFALLLYSALTIAIFKVIPVTLSLPGIAGFILTVGMAVDASILVFERIREEVAWGKPRGVAVKLGFERSWSSIKDSNISSLITAAILFAFGSGMVKGFAFTLSIGILVSLFTSVVVVRTIIRTMNVVPIKSKENIESNRMGFRKFKYFGRK